jgi:hypothetical protein
MSKKEAWITVIAGMIGDTDLMIYCQAQYVGADQFSDYLVLGE